MHTVTVTVGGAQVACLIVKVTLSFNGEGKVTQQKEEVIGEK
jgi:hypothetical protein